MKLPIGLAVVFIVISNLLIGKVCISRILFGIPCPGCGITRAFSLLFQGKIREATIMHPYWIGIVILLFSFLFSRYCVKDIKLSKKVVSVLKVCAIILLLSCIVYYIYRMMEWYPEREPMVYDSENLLYMFMRIIKEKGI